MLESSDLELFKQVVHARETYLKERQRFLSQCKNRVLVLGQMIRNPDRRTAIDLLEYLSNEELVQLLPDLVWLASFPHLQLVKVRNLISRLDRLQSISVIRNVMLDMLDEADASIGDLHIEAPEDIYRRFMELSVDLDRDLTRMIATRATGHRDAGVREAGEEYLTLDDER